MKRVHVKSIYNYDHYTYFTVTFNFKKIIFQLSGRVQSVWKSSKKQKPKLFLIGIYANTGSEKWVWKFIFRAKILFDWKDHAIFVTFNKFFTIINCKINIVKVECLKTLSRQSVFNIKSKDWRNVLICSIMKFCPTHHLH